MEIKAKEGTLQIILLSDEASLALWKGRWQGLERVFLTRAGLVLDGKNLRLTSVDRDHLNVGVFPAPAELACNGELVRRQSGWSVPALRTAKTQRGFTQARL